MFDEQKPPVNLPTGPEPDDIFANVEPAQTPRPTEFQAGRPAPTPTPRPAAAPPGVAPTTAAPQAEIKEPLVASRKLIVVGGIVVGLVVVGGIVWAVLRFVKTAATPPAAPTVEEPALQTAPEIPGLPAPPSPPDIEGIQEAPPVVPEPTLPAPADADSDGLSDAQESEAGTDPQNPDSDNDGLFDGEEVQTYGTDPLSADTDGDTYLDGQEVRGGYDPKAGGGARLFTVPSQ